MTTGTTLLTWKDGKYNSHCGKAGNIALFSINWRTRRTGKDWIMHCDLPGFAGRIWEADDRAELCETAEKVLTRWIAHVTGAGEEPE